MFAGLGLSIVFLAIGAGLALGTTGKLNELIIILTITTLSIIASFFKKVRELPKTFELGMFFILIFSVIVASLFDIHSVNGGSLSEAAKAVVPFDASSEWREYVVDLAQCEGYNANGWNGSI